MSNTTAPLFTTLADPSNDTNPESVFFGISILPIDAFYDWKNWSEPQRAVYLVRLQNYEMHRALQEDRFNLNETINKCIEVRDRFAAIYLASKSA